MVPTETREIETRARFMAVADAKGGTGAGVAQVEEQVEKAAEASEAEMSSMTTGPHWTSLWPVSSGAWGSVEVRPLSTRIWSEAMESSWYGVGS